MEPEHCILPKTHPKTPSILVVSFGVKLKTLRQIPGANYPTYNTFLAKNGKTRSFTGLKLVKRLQDWNEKSGRTYATYARALANRWSSSPVFRPHNGGTLVINMFQKGGYPGSSFCQGVCNLRKTP